MSTKRSAGISPHSMQIFYGIGKSHGYSIERLRSSATGVGRRTAPMNLPMRPWRLWSKNAQTYKFDPVSPMAKPRSRVHHGAEGQVRRNAVLHSRSRRLYYRSGRKQAGVHLRLRRRHRRRRTAVGRGSPRCESVPGSAEASRQVSADSLVPSTVRGSGPSSLMSLPKTR
jgi:hypothetical protein